MEAQANINTDKPAVAVITLPSKVVDDYAKLFEEGLRDIVAFAKSKGYTTKDDGVLMHPELGPTGFVDPDPSVVGPILAAVDNVFIPVNGEQKQLYIFAQDPQSGLIKAVDEFSEYMEFVATHLPAMDLMHYLINKVRREDGSVQEFFMIARLREDGTNEPVLIFPEQPDANCKAVFINTMGGTLESVEGKTVQEVGEEIVEHNKKLSPADATTTIRDEVDVQVRRKQ